VVVGQQAQEVRSLASGALLQADACTWRRWKGLGLWPADNDVPLLRALLQAGPDCRLLAELRDVEWWEARPYFCVLRVRVMEERIDFLHMKWSATGEGMFLAPTPDGRFILVGREADTLDVRDAASGALVRRLQVPGARLIWSVAAAPDGSVLALVHLQDDYWIYRPALARWDRLLQGSPPARGGLRKVLDRLVGSLPAEPPTAIRDLPLSYKAVWGPLVLAPDGQTLAAPADLRPYVDLQASTDGVVFWDALTLEERCRVDLRRPVWDLAFAPDGEALFVLSRDGSLRTWPWRQLVGPVRPSPRAPAPPGMEGAPAQA
jgi:hypothetical protein